MPFNRGWYRHSWQSLRGRKRHSGRHPTAERAGPGQTGKHKRRLSHHIIKYMFGSGNCRLDDLGRRLGPLNCPVVSPRFGTFGLLTSHHECPRRERVESPSFLSRCLTVSLSHIQRGILAKATLFVTDILFCHVTATECVKPVR